MQHLLDNGFVFICRNCQIATHPKLSASQSQMQLSLIFIPTSHILVCMMKRFIQAVTLIIIISVIACKGKKESSQQWFLFLYGCLLVRSDTPICHLPLGAALQIRQLTLYRSLQRYWLMIVPRLPIHLPQLAVLSAVLEILFCLCRR